MIWSCSIKSRGSLFILIVILGGLTFLLFNKKQPQPKPAPSPALAPTPDTKPSTPTAQRDNLKEEFLKLMGKDNESSANTLAIPTKNPFAAKPTKLNPLVAPAPKKEDKRAVGRKEREKLPLGVVLFDKTPVFSNEDAKKVLYTMDTGDFVRVFTSGKRNTFMKIQPGVDVYLAATSKQFEAAGNRLPDKPGFVKLESIQIFNPDQALEFTQTTQPMTLGPSEKFSTLAFYERAMKNPDPVVHRVVGPRLIEALSVHEDYNTAWGGLLRDRDSKIRSVTLASLKNRGVGNNRLIMEDLIRRLAELTKKSAKGEEEAEVLSILATLKDTKNVRVPTALQGFTDVWKQTQSQAINEAAQDILDTIPLPPPPEPKKKKKKKK